MQRMKCLKRIKSRTEENYMELVNGKPTDTQGRLDKEIRVYDFLDSLGVTYQRIDHEAAMTMEACEEIDGCWRRQSVRICFYATDRRHNFIY